LMDGQDGQGSPVDKIVGGKESAGQGLSKSFGMDGQKKWNWRRGNEASCTKLLLVG
jgi:hypothetical protein